MTSKPNLLLIHGALGSAASWEIHIATLEIHFNLFVPDLPGHDKGNTVMEESNMEWMIQWCVNYCNKNIEGEFGIAGHSMGGYMGLRLAATHLIKPTKLMCIGTKMNWNFDLATAEASKLNPEIMEQKVPAFCESLQKLHGKDWRELVLQTANILLSIGNNPIVKKELNLIEIPVQMALGTKDFMVTPTETTEAVSNIKNGQIIMLENQPHQIELVEPVMLTDAMRTFFRG